MFDQKKSIWSEAENFHVFIRYNLIKYGTLKAFGWVKMLEILKSAALLQTKLQKNRIIPRFKIKS
jgi:hypothetical protein